MPFVAQRITANNCKPFLSLTLKFQVAMKLTNPEMVCVNLASIAGFIGTGKK